MKIIFIILILILILLPIIFFILKQKDKYTISNVKNKFSSTQLSQPTISKNKFSSTQLSQPTISKNKFSSTQLSQPMISKNVKSQFSSNVLSHTMFYANWAQFWPNGPTDNDGTVNSPATLQSLMLYENTYQAVNTIIYGYTTFRVAPNSYLVCASTWLSAKYCQYDDYANAGDSYIQDIINAYDFNSVFQNNTTDAVFEVLNSTGDFVLIEDIYGAEQSIVNYFSLLSDYFSFFFSVISADINMQYTPYIDSGNWMTYPMYPTMCFTGSEPVTMTFSRFWYEFFNIGGGLSCHQSGRLSDLDTIVDDDNDDNVPKTGAFTQLKELKTKYNLQLFASYGGWTWTHGGAAFSGISADLFTTMVSNPEIRSTFIFYSYSFLISYGFDGVDFDWEYPGQLSPYDFYNFEQLIIEYKRMFPGFLISMQCSGFLSGNVLTIGMEYCPGYDESLKISMNNDNDYFKWIKRLIAAGLDRVNLMAYDYYTATSTPYATRPNTPLYNSSYKNPAVSPSNYPPVNPIDPPPHKPAPVINKCSVKTYTILNSDISIASIASRYGVSLADVCALNGVSVENANFLLKSKTINIPGQDWTTSCGIPPIINPPPADCSFTTYTVQSGDTLDGIASKQGVSSGSICSLNQLNKNVCTNIQIGQILKIPNKNWTSVCLPPATSPGPTTPGAPIYTSNFCGSAYNKLNCNQPCPKGQNDECTIYNKNYTCQQDSTHEFCPQSIVTAPPKTSPPPITTPSIQTKCKNISDYISKYPSGKSSACSQSIIVQNCPNICNGTTSPPQNNTTTPIPQQNIKYCGNSWDTLNCKQICKSNADCGNLGCFSQTIGGGNGQDCSPPSSNNYCRVPHGSNFELDCSKPCPDRSNSSCGVDGICDVAPDDEFCHPKTTTPIPKINQNYCKDLSSSSSSWKIDCSKPCPKGTDSECGVGGECEVDDNGSCNPKTTTPSPTTPIPKINQNYCKDLSSISWKLDCSKPCPKGTDSECGVGGQCDFDANSIQCPKTTHSPITTYSPTTPIPKINLNYCKDLTSSSWKLDCNKPCPDGNNSSCGVGGTCESAGSDQYCHPKTTPLPIDNGYRCLLSSVPWKLDCNKKCPNGTNEECGGLTCENGTVVCSLKSTNPSSTAEYFSTAVPAPNIPTPIPNIGIDYSIGQTLTNMQTAFKGTNYMERVYVGLAMYGRAFSGVDFGDLEGDDLINKTIGLSSNGTGPSGPYSNEAGILTYYEINTLYVWDKKGYNATYGTSIAVNKSLGIWVAYDDTDSIVEKMRVAQSFGVGGVMTFTPQQDDFRNGYPLISTVNANKAIL